MHSGFPLQFLCLMLAFIGYAGPWLYPPWFGTAPHCGGTPCCCIPCSLAKLASGLFLLFTHSCSGGFLPYSSDVQAGRLLCCCALCSVCARRERREASATRVVREGGRVRGGGSPLPGTRTIQINQRSEQSPSPTPHTRRGRCAQCGCEAASRRTESGRLAMNPGAAEAAARAAVGLYAEASSSQSGTVGFAAAQLEEQQELERMDSVEDMVGHTFFEAVKMGNATTVEDFIARGLHVEQAEGSAGVAQRRCARGATALHYAAGNGHAEVVRLLVERGDSELNSLCSIAGGTPLMWVSTQKSDHTFRGPCAQLVSQSAEAPSRAPRQAASQNRKDVVALLLAYGADPGRPVAPSMLQATWIRKARPRVPRPGSGKNWERRDRGIDTAPRRDPLQLVLWMSPGHRNGAKCAAPSGSSRVRGALSGPAEVPSSRPADERDAPRRDGTHGSCPVRPLGHLPHALHPQRIPRGDTQRIWPGARRLAGRGPKSSFRWPWRLSVQVCRG